MKRSKSLKKIQFNLGSFVFLNNLLLLISFRFNSQISEREYWQPISRFELFYLRNVNSIGNDMSNIFITILSHYFQKHAMGKDYLILLILFLHFDKYRQIVNYGTSFWKYPKTPLFSIGKIPNLGDFFFKGLTRYKLQ